MKIAIGMHLQEGSFGGGNQFGTLLSSNLKKRGHEVFFDLNEPKLDLILMTDPRTSLRSVSFGPVEIMNYVRKINQNALLVHRINECDERKGTRTLNRTLALANATMDHTVYIASWLVDLFKKQRLVFTQQYSVIKNGADPSVFTFEKKILDPSKKIKLVTHHWASNWMKGWDVYSYLDGLLDTEEFGSKFEFHYIGNHPKNERIKNIQFHSACAGKELALLIKSCDIYITASLNEPAGMHHIEGALCGLPLLYRNSGALPEYCYPYGVAFNGTKDVSSSLTRLVNEYPTYSERLTSYSNTSEKMCKEYAQLFDELVVRKQEILSKRSKKAFTAVQRIKLQYLLKALSVLNF